MDITVLIENLGPDHLACEHGLSLHLAHRGCSILLDMGSSGSFADNARALDIDLAGVELAVLSHGHYDHADGMRAFFAANDHAPVYLRRGACEGYFSMRGEGQPRFVGIHREICTDFAHRMVKVDGVYELDNGIWLVDDPAPESLADRAQHLYKKVGEDQFVPDTFSHEQSLVVEGDRGLVVFNSCCHAGVANIAGHIARTFPHKPIHALLGGFHMMGATGTDSINCSVDYIDRTARELLAIGVERLYTGHCTGMPAFELLGERLGDRLNYMRTGDRIRLE